MMIVCFVIVLPLLRMVVMVVVWLFEGAVMFYFVNDFSRSRVKFVDGNRLFLIKKNPEIQEQPKEKCWQIKDLTAVLDTFVAGDSFIV